MVAFGGIIPVLPQLIVTLEGGDTASAAGINARRSRSQP